MRVSRQQLQQQNATESADALKYAPNMMVRKRYIGDPNPVISGRNAGTLQSARSLVYADGRLFVLPRCKSGRRCRPTKPR